MWIANALFALVNLACFALNAYCDNHAVAYLNAFAVGICGTAAAYGWLYRPSVPEWVRQHMED